MKAALALSALALLLMLSPAATGLVQAPVAWSSTLKPSEVPSGQFIQFVVTGPAHGNFTVVINAQPFNASSPIAAYTFTEPNATNKTGAATYLVDIETWDVSRGPVLVRCYNASAGVFATTRLTIGDPANITRLNQTVNNQSQEIARDHAVIESYNARLDHDDLMVWVAGIISIVFCSITIAVVILLKPEFSMRRWIRLLRKRGRAVVTTTTGAYFGTGERRVVIPPDTDAIWTGVAYRDSCDFCGRAYLEPIMVAHLRGTHHVRNPTPPDDYVKDPRVLRALTKRVPYTEPSRAAVLAYLDRRREEKARGTD